MAAFLIPCLLASPLFVQLAGASPVTMLALRDTATVTASFAAIKSAIIDHGSLDDAGIASMLKSLSSSNHPAPTPTIHRRDSSASTALSVKTNGAFIAIDVGNPLVACQPSQVHTTTAAGPIQTLQFFTGSSDMRSLKLNSINGSVTEVTSTISKGDDAGSFTFDSNERISEFNVFASEKQFVGFNFKTDGDRNYKAMSSTGSQFTAQKMPVGSGILAQIRYVYCPNGIIASVGFDFLDDLESIAINNIDYSGFTNNILPASNGQTVTVGSQIIDNRNSSSDQSTSIQTTAAITKQHSLTTTVGWNVGNTVTVTGKVGIPFLTEGSVSTAATWGIQGSVASQSLTGTTITNAGTVNLKCPAGKYCVGSSFFTMFKLDVAVEATFAATTKSGHSYNWVQKGKYSGADSLAIELRVDEVNNTSSAKDPRDVLETELY
ncbi:hypothetical protein CMQ_8228 [Grosmannia clavigera kw1407]|uniref:Uncharacterized protein n=1 Tax=Grosmannia clavigera (strain kw1407 / UAMH 11150) TaxID=655863 RepID=F0XKX6_GROCL|nr:uncharacterized protein CMQ_8228 [Grosmannia clavigera kw1407]EFX01762.1 hypothetical protein CMQ_8228 [Grosmannia clavigera kw1407]